MLFLLNKLYSSQQSLVFELTFMPRAKVGQERGGLGEVRKKLAKGRTPQSEQFEPGIKTRLLTVQEQLVDSLSGR